MTRSVRRSPASTRRASTGPPARERTRSPRSSPMCSVQKPRLCGAWRASPVVATGRGSSPAWGATSGRRSRRATRWRRVAGVVAAAHRCAPPAQGLGLADAPGRRASVGPYVAGRKLRSWPRARRSDSADQAAVPNQIDHRLADPSPPGHPPSSRHPHPNSSSRGSPIPKWWATSWITVLRTIATTSASVEHTPQISSW